MYGDWRLEIGVGSNPPSLISTLYSPISTPVAEVSQGLSLHLSG